MSDNNIFLEAPQAESLFIIEEYENDRDEARADYLRSAGLLVDAPYENPHGGATEGSDTNYLDIEVNIVENEKPLPVESEKEHNEAVKYGECVENQFILRACGCRSRFCPKCCLTSGIKLKDRLKSRLKEFESLQMWTFTVDPKFFSSPEAAYVYVREKRCIAELIKVLKAKGYLLSNRWFCVVEFQVKSEMAHYHLLVESKYVPIETIKHLWNLNIPKDSAHEARAGFGSVEFSVDQFNDSDHAANYVAKYLTKNPLEWPDWVLNTKMQIRRYQVSQGFWGECTRKPPEKKKDEHEDSCACDICIEKREKLLERQNRTISQRINRCSREAGVYRVRVFEHPETGRRTKQIIEFIGNSSISTQDFAESQKIIASNLQSIPIDWLTAMELTGNQRLRL